MQTARFGPPWYFLLRWMSPSTPWAVTRARDTASLGIPPSETLSCASIAFIASAPLAVQPETAQGLTSQRLRPLQRGLVKLRFDPAGGELRVDPVADVPRLDAAVLRRADDERQ